MISIIIPTIRPQNIPIILEHLKRACTHEYEVLWEEDVERIGAPRMVKKLVDKSKYDWVVFIGDDTLPQDGCIDNALAYARKNNLSVVGFNDMHGQKGTHWIAHKSILDSLENGEFFFTGYIHNFCDDELRVRVEKLGKYGWCESAKIVHNHPAFTGENPDATYKTQIDNANWNHDKQLFARRNCKLSVVLIVKNEEALLANCLESVKDADEIIVVDTGSIDSTKEIAARFTDKIFDFEWCDDFAAARNFALSKATGDWVLSIDADETLEPGGIEKIRNLLFTSNNAIGIRMTSATYDYHVPRLFKNIPVVKWVGRIHEIIDAGKYDPCNVCVRYGSSPAHLLDPERNMRILEKSFNDDKSNTRIMFYLAREYAYAKRWEEAENMFERYLSYSTWLPEKADAHFMLAVCYWYDGKGNGEKARKSCLSAININANFKAAILLMAEMSFEKNALQWRRMAQTADNSGLLFIRERFDVI